MFAEIRNQQGERLDTVFSPGAAERRDLVVIAHGVTSHHDRPWLVALSEALGRAGIASLRLSFAGNGASEGAYGDATITKEVADLGSVLDALDGWRVAYAGHSMGAAVGVLRAADDPRIRALVSLAGMVHVRRFMDEVFGHLTPGTDVMLGKPHCPLSREFMDDARAYGSLLEQSARVDVPWLLVHGNADELVPFQDALDARAAADGRPELVELAGVDHRFTGSYDEVASAVVTWLDRLWAR